ncbi:MAG: asparagine synthase-related protein [Frankiaceae bacterium]
MSGVALAVADDAIAAVDAMLARSPHRGARRLRVGTGGAVAGVAVPDDRPDDGSVAQDGPWLCAFAGALDNAGPLAADLGLAPGSSAAEVVLAGFAARGEAFANAMRGVYGVALTDGREVAAWRDHIGLMPLHYRVDGAAVVVATEAKQVIAGAGLPYEPDLDVVVAILHEDITDETPAALRGVSRLRKGSVLRTGPGRPARTTGYWHPEDVIETGRYADDELQDRFDELMAQAVARSMRGDDVVLLSGGIDSPAVAAYASSHSRAAYGHPVDALSTVYPDYPAVDESELITLVATAFGMPLRTYSFDEPHLAELQDWMRLADGPVPTVVLADAADAYRRSRAMGRSTVLTGDLAEFVIDQRDHVAAHYLRRGQLRHLVRELGYRRGRPGAARRIAAELLSAAVPHPVKVAVRDRRPPDVRPMLAPWLDPSLHLLPRVAEKSPVAHRWREGQYRFLEGPGLSVEADEVCQEACGVRARHPWVDIDLWELFLSLPAAQKHPGPLPKALVRRLLRGGVPDEILDRRRKVVFNDAVVGRIDYDALTRWLKAPTTRLPGVDYDVLWQRVERRDLDIVEYMWAKDLAATHAFLALWD